MTWQAKYLITKKVLLKCKFWDFFGLLTLKVRGFYFNECFLQLGFSKWSFSTGEEVLQHFFIQVHSISFGVHSPVDQIDIETYKI